MIYKSVDKFFSLRYSNQTTQFMRNKLTINQLESRVFLDEKSLKRTFRYRLLQELRSSRVQQQLNLKMESDQDFNNNIDGIQSEQLYRKPKKQMNYQTSLRSGPWSREENIKYVIFIDNNRTHLTSKSKRRQGRIFKEMSIFLTTRNSIQCRSHHQKQLYKYKNITKIIIFYQKFYDFQSLPSKVSWDNQKNISDSVSLVQNKQLQRVKIQADKPKETQNQIKNSDFLTQPFKQQFQNKMTSLTQQNVQGFNTYGMNTYGIETQLYNWIWVYGPLMTYN